MGVKLHVLEAVLKQTVHQQGKVFRISLCVREAPQCDVCCVTWGDHSECL
jgi:hypothetical protein